MSNNPFTPIHNDVIEALCKINLSPYETRLLFAIFRKTFGYIDKKTNTRKKNDWISGSQLSKMTELDRRLVHRALKGLEKKNVINRDDKKIGLTKRFMKIMSSKEMTINNSMSSVAMTPVISSDDNLSSVAMHTKEKKENIKERLISNNPTLFNTIVKEQGPTEYYKIFMKKFNKIFNRNFRVNVGLVDKLRIRMTTYSFEEILKALEILGEDRFNHGENERGWQASPEYLLRTDAQIDRFLNQPSKKEQDKFKKPDKQLAVEITVMAGLMTGVWDNSVRAIYGLELIPWMKKNNRHPDFDNTVELLVKFIQAKQPKPKVNELSWSIVIGTYERYLKTCKELKIDPRESILQLGKKVQNEH